MRVTHNSHTTEKPMALEFQSNWNLEMLIFVEGGKPENPEKNPQNKYKNQQQTQPTYDTGHANRTWATLVGGKRDYHYAIPAPQLFFQLLFQNLHVRLQY